MPALKACLNLRSALISGPCYAISNAGEPPDYDSRSSVLLILRELPAELRTLQLLVVLKPFKAFREEPSVFMRSGFVQETRWDMIQNSLAHCSQLETLKIQAMPSYKKSSPIKLDRDVCQAILIQFSQRFRTIIVFD